MRPIHTFNVLPSVPDRLAPLLKIAHNLRWAWDHDTIELFRRIDDDLWKSTNHNPIRMLGSVDQEKLEVAANDEGCLAHMERVAQELDRYLNEKSTWFKRKHSGVGDGLLAAYFSAEFGATECLSIFAGGLGILAGDHLKASSDLGVPLVGVGLLYQQGYFKQYLNAAGWQQESYEDNDFHNLPLTLVRDARVAVDLPDGSVTAQVWRADVGRVSLYLLDANIPENTPAHRDITDQLYGGDSEMRLKQEILLGIGGYRALVALGLRPTVFHANEGHSAFLALEHIRQLMETRRLSFNEARMVATSALVFTTHTPVPAGHDRFDPRIMARYFGAYAARLGLSWHDFLALGRVNPQDEGELFCMTVLALRLASFSNGVSALHGEVSRKMWSALWPGVPLEEIPIAHVTNGVHFRSWVSAEMNQLYDRYLGPRWREENSDPELWKRVETIPAEELWRTHERRRERLVSSSRRQLREQLRHRGARKSEQDLAKESLVSDALTIGFARRFATYKRATLLLRDPARLSRILNDPQRPVQIIYAGKAHPRDDAGKEFIRSIVDLARKPEFRRRIVFLEDYDMAVARSLVQGTDVWLNTPRRPEEASGTSGMKAMANGCLNLSILDGWWDEAWRDAEKAGNHPGWAIGAGEDYDNAEYQDQVESQALYDLLEHDVVPAFYERGPDGVPRRWVARMRDSLRTLAPQYNMNRAVRQYTEEIYLIAHQRCAAMSSDDGVRARAVAAWLEHTRSAWAGIRIVAIENGISELTVNTRVTVRARIFLGPLTPDDVQVELFVGRVAASDEMRDTIAFQMKPTGDRRGDVFVFETPAAHAATSGLHGYTVRVLPYHPDLVTPFVPGLITWAPDNVALVARA
jgi:glycogen phosphorylase